MLSNFDEVPPAVFVDPSGRRRRALRSVLFTLTSAWTGLGALLVVGLTSGSDAPMTVLAGPGRQPAPSAAPRVGQGSHHAASARRSQGSKEPLLCPSGTSGGQTTASQIPGAPAIAQALGLTWEQIARSQFGNLRASEQAIGLSAAGPRLGSLGTAAVRTWPNQVTVHYPGGTVRVSLNVAKIAASVPRPANVNVDLQMVPIIAGM